MRADRLLSELLLLQVRGKMSASELASELEVSERTIYRDMIALSSSGVPIFSETGVRGGYQLIDGYRTQLTGMNDEELRALFALNVPSALAALGMDGPFHSAMRKLQAALPVGRGDQSQWMQQRFYFDVSPWQEHVSSESRTILNALQTAIWRDQKVLLDLAVYPYGSLTGLEMNPYSLVTKENRWYLIASRKEKFCVTSLNEIRKVEPLPLQYERDFQFNLMEFWEDWLRVVQEGRNGYLVVVEVATQHWENVAYQFRRAINSSALVDDAVEVGEWRKICLCFDNLQDARNRLIPLGRSVRIVSPEPLRLSIIDHAMQIVGLYQDWIRTESEL